MSLVPTFVKCRDTKFYKELVYRDPDNQWYICFDDDDPVELVMRESCPTSPKEILDKLQFPWIRIGRKFYGERCFRGSWDKATWVYIEIKPGPFPVPGPHDTYDWAYDRRPNKAGVYFGCT